MSEFNYSEFHDDHYRRKYKPRSSSDYRPADNEAVCYKCLHVQPAGCGFCGNCDYPMLCSVQHDLKRIVGNRRIEGKQ